MACRVVDLSNGATAIVCTRGKRETCWNRGCDRNSEALCDCPVGDGRTCDRRLCYKHRHRMGAGVDYCSEHLMADREAKP